MSTVFHQSPHRDYAPRTLHNATSVDLTVAVAINYNTAGERLTKRLASPNYLAVPYGLDITAAIDLIHHYCVDHNVQSLNIAGNGIYTFYQVGVTQDVLNEYMYLVLKGVLQLNWSFTHIVSGGQTGIDWAGLVAATALGIPAVGTFPQGYRRRNIYEQDYTTTPVELTQLLWEDIWRLSGGAQF